MSRLFAPSLLDKLLADDHAVPAGAAAMRFSVEQVKESVARDIETLLNARPGLAPEQRAAHPEAARSMLGFGLVDIASLSIASDRDRARITASIAAALADHEPRLAQVEVGVAAGTAPGEGLRFSIRARLRLAPSSEPVAFDAVLLPGSHRYAVSRGRPAPVARPV